jgi:hypothetical protein
MNEQIKQLALAAGGSHYPDVGGRTLEKFAELLIRECAQLAEDIDGHPRARKIVLEHFGVES